MVRPTPDEVVNAEFDEPSMNFRFVTLPEQLYEPLNFLVAHALGVAAVAAKVLDVSETLHMHHSGVQERADQDLVVVRDVDLGLVPADRFVRGSSPCSNMVWHAGDVPNRLCVDRGIV